MFHQPSVEWTHLQAQALGMPHEVIDLTDTDEMRDLQHALVKMKSRDEISGFVTGAGASDYQKTRFDNMCDAIGLKTYSPLWHKNPRLLVDDLKKSGFRIILTAVDTPGLNEPCRRPELTQ